jgi:serine/threonine protein kinase
MIIFKNLYELHELATARSILVMTMDLRCGCSVMELIEHDFVPDGEPPSKTSSRASYTLVDDPGQALAIFTDLIEGLEYLHRLGIIHSDIKPGKSRLSVFINLELKIWKRLYFLFFEFLFTFSK